jgi:HD-GYP domain-containing protein (c-di-GMP phosphodiesterase class II)
VRLVPLNQVPDGAELGKDVSSGRADGMPLLRSGNALTARYKDALRRAGVHAVYIRDAATEGIEPKELLSAETRAKATQAVAQTFETASEAFKTGRPLSPDAIEQLDKIAARMAREVAETSEFALALADLSGSDGYTLQHSVDVAGLGLLMGQRLFRDRGYIDYRGKRVYDKVDNRLTRLGLGLLLHDIGKLAIPTEILTKPGRLDPHEWEIMKTHPTAGTDLLRSELISPLVKVVVRHHHERWDGAGYPDGKAGTDIHELARIASIADVYDAITSERVYASAQPAHVGVRVIREGRGEAFDAEMVDVFSKIVAPFPPGDAIELSDGRGGVVASVPEDNLDRPVVRVIGDGAPYDLPLVDHPRIQIVGWEDMGPALEAPEKVGGWAI